MGPISNGLITGLAMEPTVASEEFHELCYGALLSNLSSTRTNASRMDDAAERSLDQLRFYTYGIVMPTVCALGIFGNILNLAVLTRPHMKNVSHIYMRGYAVSALLAIAFAIPFCVRMTAHEEVGQWVSYPVAFYHSYVELYVGNAFVGNGVMMMIALTLERYVAICHPTRTRADSSTGAPRAYAVVIVVPVLCLLIYLPYMFHAMIDDCRNADGQIIYQRRDNTAILGTIWYNVYQWLLQCIFRLLPVTILGWLNVCIIVAYRRVCSKRRKLTRRPKGDDSKNCGSDARRLMFLLGVTSFLFFVCMTPVAALSIMFSTEMYLDSFSFQVFRAVANVLEIVNFAMTFYIYCLFSTEFRQTFLQLIGCDAWLASRAKASNVPATAGVSYAVNGQQPSPSPAAINLSVTTPALGKGQSSAVAQSRLIFHPSIHHQKSPIRLEKKESNSIARISPEPEFGKLLRVPTPSSLSNSSHGNGFEMHFINGNGANVNSHTNGHTTHSFNNFPDEVQL